MTTQTTSDGSPQVLTAAGPSLPVIISLDSQQSALPPTISVISSPDGNYAGQIEFTLDRPDGSGRLPSPGNWIPYDGFGITGFGAFVRGAVVGPAYGGAITGYGTIKNVMTAVRCNIQSYVAGTCTFSVSQAVIPKLHGGL